MVSCNLQPSDDVGGSTWQGVKTGLRDLVEIRMDEAQGEGRSWVQWCGPSETGDVWIALIAWTLLDSYIMLYQSIQIDSLFTNFNASTMGCWLG